MTAFRKPPHSVAQQIDKLKARGLAIPDQARAEHYLQNISYFRLSAYTRPFYAPDAADHRFIDGTSFDDILRLYIFDRELRLLLLDAIERLEVALRAQITNTLAEHHGPHGYLDPTVFHDRYNHAWLLERLNALTRGRDAEAFLAHYRNKYHGGPDQPPIWMAVEVLTFKEVSTLFAHLRQPADTQRIESHFHWKYPVLRSWFRSLSDLRNVCAHHGRVWNREFGSRPEMPRKVTGPWPGVPISISTGSRLHPEQQIEPRKRLYLQAVVIEALMSVVSPGSGWAERLFRLLQQYPAVSRPHMGFPDGWHETDFWSGAIGRTAQEASR